MKRIIIFLILVFTLSGCEIISPPEVQRQDDISIQSFFTSEEIGEEEKDVLEIEALEITLEDLSSQDTDDEIEINELLDILFENSDDSNFITY